MYMRVVKVVWACARGASGLTEFVTVTSDVLLPRDASIKRGVSRNP